MFGLSLSAFTSLHVVISLVAILTGLVVLYGLLKSSRMDGWTFVFLLTTVLTSVTGFLFPFNGFTPAIAFGILSMILLIAAIAARYTYHLAGSWRWIYVVGAVLSLYLNCFVLVVQSFLKIPTFNALAPTGSEPPFAIAQGIVLVFFIVTGFLAVRRFHPIGG